MKPIFFSLLFIMSLFAMNLVFPYENQCPPTDAEQASSYQAPAQASADDSKFYGQVLTNTAYDSCLMNPKNFEMPDDNYKGSLKDFFAERPIIVQPCKNCHVINSPSDSDNQNLYQSRTKEQNEQAAYDRMMKAYNKEEQDSKTYTGIVKKHLAEGHIRKP